MLKKKSFERYHINSCTFWAFDMKKLEEFFEQLSGGGFIRLLPEKQIR